MKLLRAGAAGSERPMAVDEDGLVRDLGPLGTDIDGHFLSAEGLETARRALRTSSLAVVGHLEAGVVTLGTGERIGPPMARPGKIICIGLNYRGHAAEAGAQVPAEPVLFMKAPNTVVGPYDDIAVPRASHKTDWEVELGVVIGSQARYLASPAAAAAVVAGYVGVNDVSEREFQLERGGQWDKGKSCETFNPVGPWLLTADEVADPQDLRLRCWVNGELRQDSNTADMIFGVHHVVWYLSQFMVLEPGDLINTGTPAGVSFGHDDVPYLRAGDRVEVEVDGLGHQSCAVVQAR
ncbi:MAG: fumarylacetoacetate hydrolase family protein [Acidimicrobiales bacterium]